MTFSCVHDSFVFNNAKKIVKSSDATGGECCVKDRSCVNTIVALDKMILSVIKLCYF